MEDQLEQQRDDNLDLKFALSADFRGSANEQMDPEKSKKIIRKLQKLGIITNLSDLRDTNVRLQSLMSQKFMQEEDKEVDL